MITVAWLGCAGEGEPPPPSSPEGWQTVAEGLGGALLSVSGTSADDVWTVGADDGAGPLVLRFDGSGWARLDTGTRGDLWWVWLPGRDGVAWAVGEGGRVLHAAGGEWTEELVADPAVTLFGVWGSAEDDVWVVGGDVAAGSGPALHHWDGSDWSEPPLPPEVAASQAVYKVFGRSADDVWACGTDGNVMRWDGDTWALDVSGTDRTLLTVHGDDSGTWAVGGLGNADIRGRTADSWTDESPPFAPELNGVYARAGEVVAVGRTGAVWRRADGVWAEDAAGRATFRDLHGVYVDPDGGVWAAGGQIAARPLTDGTLVFQGDREVAPVP